MTLEYSKKSVLVTGGARGIGRAIAETLAGRGWRVAVADIQGSSALFFVRCDVAREPAVRGAVRKVIASEKKGSGPFSYCRRGHGLKAQLAAGSRPT